METRLIFVHALSPLHAGTGQGVDVIDLPIAREKATGIPFLPGSSLKGVLRDRCSDKERCKAIFGPEPRDGEEYASSVQFSDQRLLLMPIRSLKGTFAWVTSPYILRRFAREVQDVGLTIPATIPQPAEQDAWVVHVKSALSLRIGNADKVILEDLDLDMHPDPVVSDVVGAWGKWLAPLIFPGQQDWQAMLLERLCIIHDDMFSFLLQTATEITARIRLKEDTKTVEKGALWYEEALPTETILSGLVAANPTKKSGKKVEEVFEVIKVEEVFEVIEVLSNRVLQVGGKATVGRGLCRVQMVKGGASHANT